MPNSDVKKSRTGLRRRLAPGIVGLALLAAAATGLLAWWVVLFAAVAFAVSEAAFLWARRKILSSAALLLPHMPARARVLRKEGAREIKTRGVRRGEMVLVAHEEIVPLDGVIVDGKTVVDENEVMGAKGLFPKEKGDVVFAGSRNLGGVIRLKSVQESPEHSMAGVLSRCAQHHREHIRGLISAGSRRRLYGVSSIVFLTAIAVLFIRYMEGVESQSLLLLVVALAVGAIAGYAARGEIFSHAGVLAHAASQRMCLSGPDAAANAMEIDTVVFDKRGLLTERDVEVKRVETVGVMSEKEVVRLAAIAEHLSRHPIASAIVRLAIAGGATIADAKSFHELPGLGVEAFYGGERLLVGNERLMVRFGVAFPAEPRDEVSRRKEDSKVFVAYEGKMVGRLVIREVFRQDVLEAVRRLGEEGFEMVLLSGDDDEAARRFADAAGIRRFFANVLPQDRMSVVHKLKSEGKRVAFIGRWGDEEKSYEAADFGVAVGSSECAGRCPMAGAMRNDVRDAVGLLLFARDAKKFKRRSFVLAMAGFLLVAGGISVLPAEFAAGGVIAAGFLRVSAAGIISLQSFRMGVSRKALFSLTPPHLLR